VLDLAVAMAATPVQVGDDLFARLRQHFSDAQLVELVTDLAMGHLRSRFNRVFHCQPAGFSEGTFCPLPERPGQA
jgi:alkylhydroperoxidase family enzyme